MIDQCLLLQETSLDPVHNLAVESTLLSAARPGVCVLYLWQNQHTVVIGRNQSAWRECRVAELEAEGGALVRRPSGGGAVYHDLGNLNFSFVVPEREYDVPRQLSVILEALKEFGLNAEVSGRNDILLGGLKFSGNAFLQEKGYCLHHGTLLLNVDMQKLTRYLKPSELKLQSKGIASVGARVVNLQEVCPSITVAALCGALTHALGRVYGAPVVPSPNVSPENPVLRAYEEKYRSRDWVLGRSLEFSREVHDRFPWGEARLGIQLQDDLMVEVALFTDAMDADLPVIAQKALTGLAFTWEAISRLRVKHSGNPLGDLAGLLLLHLQPNENAST